jgi:hypothetical protein
MACYRDTFTFTFNSNHDIALFTPITSAAIGTSQEAAMLIALNAAMLGFLRCAKFGMRCIMDNLAQ